MDIGTIMKLKPMWRSFRSAHPELPELLRRLKGKSLSAGTELTVSINYPDGENVKAEIKLSSADAEMIGKIMGIIG